MTRFWLRDLVEPCGSTGCTSKATKEVVNSHNSPCGRYCARHARQWIRDREAQQARAGGA